MHMLQRLAPATARAAVAQYVASELTGRPPSNPVPAYHDLCACNADDRQLAALIDAIEPSGQRVPWHARAALTEALDPGFELVSRQYPIPAHRAIVRRIRALNFRPQRLVLGLDGLDVFEIGEAGPIPRTTNPNAETAEASVRHWGSIVTVSRQELVNDGALGYLSAVGESLVAAAYRKEQAETMQLLETGATLADGEAWFDSTNSVTEASEVTALAAGIEKFHQQQFANGSYVGATPAYLVCPPDWSIILSDVLADMALTRPTITVMKSPHITSAFLLADPAMTPAVGLLTLNDQPMLTSGKPPLKSDMGLLLKVEHAFRAVPLSRRGIVKITKS